MNVEVRKSERERKRERERERASERDRDRKKERKKERDKVTLILKSNERKSYSNVVVRMKGR